MHCAYKSFVFCHTTQELHHARTNERAAEEVARRLQEEARRVDAEKMELEQEKIVLSNQIALLQTQISLAVRESFTRPANEDAPSYALDQAQDFEVKQVIVCVPVCACVCVSVCLCVFDVKMFSLQAPSTAQPLETHSTTCKMEELQEQVAALEILVQDKEALLQEKTRALQAQDQQILTLQRRSQQVLE